MFDELQLCAVLNFPLLETRRHNVYQCLFGFIILLLQPADIGWPTGNGKKLRCTQAQLGQATCLGAA